MKPIFSVRYVCAIPARCATVLAMLALTMLALVACASGTAPEATPEEASNPKPGAMLSGGIKMGEESGGSVTLIVSDDGTTVDTLLLSFGLLSQTPAFWALGEECSSAFALLGPSLRSIPISGGRFTAESPIFGMIEGRFTSPTTASGRIHLYKSPLDSPHIECGVWEWQAEE